MEIFFKILKAQIYNKTFDKNELRIQFVCKQHVSAPESNPFKRMKKKHNEISEKFLLLVPIFITCKIPFSAYKNFAIYREIAEFNQKHPQSPNVVIKGNKFTQQQPIHYTEFIITNNLELTFFIELHKKYLCCVDFDFQNGNFARVFEIQQQINYGCTFKLDTTKVKLKKTFKIGFNKDCNFDIFQLWYPISNNLDKKTFIEKVKSIWSTLSDECDSLEFNYQSCVFDIETGYFDSSKIREFVQPYIGYVQIISFVTFHYTKSFENEKYFSFILCSKEEKDELVKLCRHYETYFDFQIIFEVFTDEKTLLEMFTTLLAFCDTHFGYNTIKFDLPFIHQRLFVLQNQLCNIELMKEYQYNFINLCETSPFERLSFGCSCHSLHGMKCTSCSAFTQTTNSKRLKCNKCNQLFDFDKRKATTFYYKERHVVQILPFGTHVDLYKNMLFSDVENKKLETVSLKRFSKQCASCENIGDNMWRIKINGPHFFTKNIKATFFTQDQVFNIKTIVATGKVVNVGGLDIQIHCEENLSFYPSLFISIGKTSNLTLVQQQLAIKAQDLLQVSLYCTIDTYLTYGLEILTRNHDRIGISKDLKMPVFDAINWTAGDSSQFSLCYILYPKLSLVRFVNFYHIREYFLKALEEEGIRRTDSIVQDKLEEEQAGGGGLLIKKKPVQYVLELLFDTENMCIDEFNMGLGGEFDTSNIDELKKALHNLVV